MEGQRFRPPGESGVVDGRRRGRAERLPSRTTQHQSGRRRTAAVQGRGDGPLSGRCRSWMRERSVPAPWHASSALHSCLHTAAERRLKARVLNPLRPWSRDGAAAFVHDAAFERTAAPPWRRRMTGSHTAPWSNMAGMHVALELHGKAPEPPMKGGCKLRSP
jgi:hypothetical protein